jgi:formate dehydrogenase (coenzyme F420) alpha subunit
MAPQRKPTTCQICLCDCGLYAVVEDGKVLAVEGDPENPQSRGGMCVKGAASPRIVNAPDRLTRPLRRRPGGGFEEIGWDRALGEIAEKLRDLREREGPESLCLHYGRSTRFIDRAFFAAFGRLYGTPNVTGVWSLCVGSKLVAYEETFGPPLFPWCDFPNANAIVLWGTNPRESRMHRYFRVYDDLREARRRGAKLVVVDPRAPALAREANLHLALNPGTDAHLALALLRILLDEGWHDAAIVAAHTEGFEELREAVSSVDVEAAARVTGVASGAMREFARILGTLKPCSFDRREGTIHLRNGTQVNRALAILCAVTGNVDVPGGLTFNFTGPWKASLGIQGNVRAKPFWAEEFPLAVDATGQLPLRALGGEWPVLRALFCLGANPATTLPGTAETVKALRALELLVVDDLFLTETAELAHYVLPGASFFEKGELEVGPFKRGDWVKVTAPVVPPAGEARPEWRVMAELAARLGHPELAAFQDEDEVARRVFLDSGRPELDPTELRKGKLLAPLTHGTLLREGFRTQSGKIQLLARRFERLGYPPLPVPEDACPTSKAFPWRLVTGARVMAYNHSQHRNIPELRKLCPEPLAEISEEIARRIGAMEGDAIRVETAWGSMELPATVVAGMNPNTVGVPHGWTGAQNVNRILSPACFDPISATPAYKAVPCRVRRVGDSRPAGLKVRAL